MLLPIAPSAHRVASALCGLSLLVAGLHGASAQSFTDVTTAAGVDYLHYQITDPPRIHGPEYMTGGAAMGDVDGDGWPDLFVTRYDAHDLLFRNEGDGSFEDISVASGLTAFDLASAGGAFGDVDGDGDLDLYVTTHEDTRYYLFINDGSGSFTEEAVARGASLSGPDLHYGFSASFGDYDRDGYLDLHVNEWRRDFFNPTLATSNARLLRNLGASNPGHFEDTTDVAGVAMDDVPLIFGVLGTTTFTSRFTDLDDDGWQDLVIAADFGSSRLFWNEKDGTFKDRTVNAGVGGDENGMGSAVGDVDGDGDLDWFVTSIYDPLALCQCDNGLTGNRLYLNNGNRSFTDGTDAWGVRDGGWGWGALFFDYDNDGDLDLTMNNGQDWPDPAVPGADAFMNDAARLFRNDGTSMTEVAAAEGLVAVGSGKAVVRFDYDRDGDEDVFLVTNSGHPHLYRNDVGNQNDWIRIDLDATGANQIGIGARVRVQEVDGGPWLYRDVAAGNHFLAQSETTAHFGLGPGPGGPVHKVEVRFRPGHLRVYPNLARNQVHTLKEVPSLCGLIGLEPLVVWLAVLARRRSRA